MDFDEKEYGFDTDMADNKGLDEYLNSSEFKEDSIYWKKHLSGIGKYLKYYNIPSDNYNKIRIDFDNQKFASFLNQHNSSQLEFITAIFSLYLSRIDGTEGCLLKTAISTNEDGDNDKSSLLKINYHKDNLFLDYLNEIKEVFNEAVEHTKIDIAYYVEDDFSSYSIYDCADFKEVSAGYCGESALSLDVYDHYLDLSYNSDLFSDIYIRHMADNIASLIDNVLNNSNQKCGSIEILSDEEKVLLSDFSKGKSIDTDKEKTLSMAFRENALKYPDLLAIDDGVNQINYGELESSTNSIGYDLINNYNIESGDCIGLMLPRTYHFLELVLALNKIGAAFIPIDPNYPLKRIEHMLDLSESKYLITTREFAKGFELNCDIIYLEDLNRDLNQSIECMGTGDDLFAIYFTSGTTGLPKGVMVSNKQITGVTATYKHVFKTSVGDLIGYFASFSFIASLRLFEALVSAESCRIFNETEQKDSLLLIKALKEQEMSDLILPPSIGIPIFENEDIKLKHLILAGAKLEELSNKESSTRLVNFYGATELIMGMVKIFDLNDDALSLTVGKPVPNTWAYILDDEGMTLPIGVPGEICISGDFISPGYYRNPELTREVFVDNPHSTCPENKIMYRTGDIGFYNFDGEIQVIGRLDDQLSVRGFRIESGEILSVIKDFPEISDIYLDVDHDNLIAYYTTGSVLDIDIVKEALKSELPDYMVPSLFVELDAIPLNPNGKLDKNALKSKVYENSSISIGDEVLQSVVDGFKEVLNVDFVFIDDDFIQLGGNSLSLMKLQLLLNERLGVNLSSSELMELGSPIRIADHIKYNLEVHSPISINYTYEDLCPLSESQLNVYLDETVNEMGTAYNNPFKIDFNDSYSAEDIRKAIDKLLIAYPVLKARVVNAKDVLSFSFDGDVEIAEGNPDDIDSFLKPFDFGKSLSRFLIAKSDDAVSLCMDCHHLIFDGTSANILLDSLMPILDGKDLDLIDDGILREISYEENIASDYMEEALEFFDSMFADRDEAYDLLPSVKTEENSDFEYIDVFDIDNDLLSSFLKEHSITNNQFFASAFAYALSKFSGSSKVLFNLIEDGRGHIDLSESIGMFVRTLPLIIDCKNQECESFLEYSSDIIKSAMKYDLYPFRILANRYDLNSDVLFQYSHNLFNSMADDGKFPYDVHDLKQDLMGDLSFFVFDVDDGKLGIKILYSEKFSLEFIERFAESYKMILREIIGANLLSDINYTSDDDLIKLDAYNKTEHDLDYSDILDAFNDNLAKYQDSPLVSYKDLTYTYGESAFLADRIAKSLMDMGVQSQDNVAFLVERSELYMLSALAIMSIGAVYVPIDDAHPDESIRFILNDSGAKVIIVCDSTYERANSLANDVALLNISDIVKEDIGTISSLPISYGDLACILYTSGTTGVPKGVKITRKGITSYVDFYVNEYDMKNGSTFGMFASIGFDVGAIRGICAPLYGGSCLDVVPMDIRLDMDKLNCHFISHGVTHTTLPTQVARMFIEEVEETSLKVLITGGEKLGEIDASVDYSFIDSYGPTECCVAVCAIEEMDKMDSSSIGHLFSNVKAYVLDDEGRRVPIGAVGELCISGSQLAKGYLNREIETKESFVENPFESDESYCMMYATGDLARVLPDGTLGIVGRRDGQVKIRGNRVELLEVEAAIREMDSIDQVTVQAIEHEGNYELVAYVVCDEENPKESVCTYVADHKPNYMVPTFVVKMDNIPLNVNGKVDRRALPEVDRSSLKVEYIAPRNEKERVIVEAFEKVFNQERIGVNDDFVALGGDSLIGIKLLSHLEDYSVTMADVLSLRTPAAIADSIDEITWDLDIYSVDGGCPLNEAQVTLLTGIFAQNNADFYHIPIKMQISKEYGIERILEALDEILNVHPILAMHISNHYETRVKKGFFEGIRENIDLLKELGNTYEDSSLVDLLSVNEWNIKKIYRMFRALLKLFKGDYPYLEKGEIPPIAVESNLKEDSFREFMDESMDIYKNLSMFRIFELEDSYLLFGKGHHLIFDAISENVFKRDLQLLLDGEKLDVDDSFLRMSAFHQQIKDTDKYAEATEFFDSMFADIEEVDDLVGDDDAEGFSLETYDLDFDYGAFKTFLEDMEISENLFFISAFSYALSRFVDSDNVSFAMIDNGRDRFNDYDAVGLYANVVPLVIDCRNQSIDSFIDHSSDMLYGALKYNYYPLILIYQKYGLDSPSVVFQFVPDWITYDALDEQNDGGSSSEFGNSIIDDIVSTVGELPIDFVVQVFQTGEQYKIIIANSNKFSSGMIEDFKNTYCSILSNIIHRDRTSDLGSTLKDDK